MRKLFAISSKKRTCVVHSRRKTDCVPSGARAEETDLRITPKHNRIGTRCICILIHVSEKEQKKPRIVEPSLIKTRFTMVSRDGYTRESIVRFFLFQYRNAYRQHSSDKLFLQIRNKHRSWSPHRRAQCV